MSFELSNQRKIDDGAESVGFSGSACSRGDMPGASRKPAKVSVGVAKVAAHQKSPPPIAIG
jgi:hypothetical protein